jgi:hypothetical protein
MAFDLALIEVVIYACDLHVILLFFACDLYVLLSPSPSPERLRRQADRSSRRAFRPSIPARARYETYAIAGSGTVLILLSLPRDDATNNECVSDYMGSNRNVQ